MACQCDTTIDESTSRKTNYMGHQQQGLGKLVSLRYGVDKQSKFPSLVVRRILTDAVMLANGYMDDLLFLLACIFAVAFLFPTMDESILDEIEQARKELGLDLLQATINHYHDISALKLK